MRIHYLQHAPFECLGTIKKWIHDNNIAFTSTRLYDGEALPAIDSFDWLIIMGGPMNVDDIDIHPWLLAEKKFIELAMQHGKKVLGICLGAQLIAEILGAKVSRNHCKEIGWFPVKLTIEAQAHPLFKNLPAEFMPFHWHGDTFSLPQGAVRIASSSVTQEQGFIYNDTVVGLQFHLEVNHHLIEGLTRRFPDELIVSSSVQNAEMMLADPSCFNQAAKLKRMLLDQMLQNKGA